MTDSLLNSDDQGIDPNKNYLEELVGDGKKFKTVEDLAKGKYEADMYIRTKNKAFDDLSADYLRLQTDYNARQKLEELIDQLNNQALTSNANNPPVKEADQQMPTFDPSQIESLVSSKIQEHEVTKTQANNFNLVKTKLIEQFGNNYPTVVKQRIDELGISEDEFNSLARRNPKLVFKTLDLDRPQNTQDFHLPNSTVNSDNSSNKGGQKRTWMYYQKLKKDNFALYRDPKTQMQMNKDYAELGQEFEDGDFHRYSH